MNELDVKKNTIAAYFNTRQSQVLAALPKVGITAERMVRLVFSAINQTPKLLNCTPETLFNAMIQCASLGLEPNTRLQHAFFVPFGNKVQLIIGYQGLILLAHRSDDISSVKAHAVREGDLFEYEFGLDEKLRHIPNWDDFEGRKDKITFAYAVVVFKDGTKTFEIMSRAEIDSIRKRSKTPNDGPWVTDYEMMCRKTVIKRLMHYIPLSTNKLSEAIKIDGENEAGLQDMTEILEVEDMQTTKKKSNGKLEAMAEAEEEITPKKMLTDMLLKKFEGNVDEMEEWLERETGSKLLHSISEEKAINLVEKLR